MLIYYNCTEQTISGRSSYYWHFNNIFPETMVTMVNFVRVSLDISKK